MEKFSIKEKAQHLINLLRWNKPSGRLILLIPAGWTLWLAPSAPPERNLVFLITLGGLLVSASGCIANDLWDRNIDSQVSRTKNRPLANRKISKSTALIILIFLLFTSLQIIFLLPATSVKLCLKLATLALVPILIYPSSKRWFQYPQILLAICWGFAVLIPWSASESSLSGGIPLLTCWLGTMTWTFGFDTVYAMADKLDDQKLGLNSSAISLGADAFKAVSICYGLTSLLIASSAFSQGIGILFWPLWLIASIGMQREIVLVKRLEIDISNSSRHFKNQVLLGSLILLGLIIGKA